MISFKQTLRLGVKLQHFRGSNFALGGWARLGLGWREGLACPERTRRIVNPRNEGLSKGCAG